MNIQARYWKFLVQLKMWIFYLDYYADSSYKCERSINVFTAITASSSIAAWALWSNYSFVWAFIIAASQVLNAVRVYLPFSKRLEIIKPFSNDLQLLYTKVDYNWFKVSNGDLKAEEINDILFSLKKEYSSIEKKNLKSSDLLQNKKIKKLADQKAEEFFENNY